MSLEEIVAIVEAVLIIAFGALAWNSHAIFPKHHKLCVSLSVIILDVLILITAFANAYWISTGAYIALISIFAWYYFFGAPVPKIFKRGAKK